MKKVILLTGCLACNTFSAFANSESNGPDDYGFYLGGDFTATIWEFDQDNNININYVDQIPLSDLSHKTTTSFNVDNNVTDYSVEVRGGGYLRWDENDDWLSAIEIFAAPHDASFSDQTVLDTFGRSIGDTNNINFTQSTKAQYSFGADFKQGLFFDEDEWLVFAKAGIIFTHFETVTNAWANNDSTFPISTAYDKFYLTGVRFGAGLERFFGENISFTLQALYALYEDENSTISGSQGKNDGFLITVTDEFTFNPSGLQIGAGVNFYF